MEVFIFSNTIKSFDLHQSLINILNSIVVYDCQLSTALKKYDKTEISIA